jgi:hypothetical protein
MGHEVRVALANAIGFDQEAGFPAYFLIERAGGVPAGR